jgi:hypothetical protein
MVPPGDSTDDLLVEIKGEKDGDVTPETVDALTFLQLASGYVEYMHALAKIDGEDLGFKGIEIRRGSARVATKPTSLDSAREYADRTANCVEGIEPPPPTMERRTQALGAVFRALLPGQSAGVRISKWSRMVRLPEVKPPELYWESTSLRVTPIRAGGIEPRVRFESVGEPAAFSLRADPETARQLGGLLYREVEITASILRGDDGRIRTGRIETVDIVSDDDPITAWTAWLKRAAPRWDEVSDIEAELGRRDE